MHLNSRKLFVAGLILLLLTTATIVVGQGGGEPAEVPITTSASRVVGVGSYVAAEAYGVAAGEDPAEEPAQAIIMPYGIYPNMHVNVIEDFVQPEPAVEGFTFAWSLEPAEGSAAELIEGNVAIFQADVAGEYLLTLTATDPDGNEAETTWAVLATVYVGNGFLDGPQEEETQCIDCHEERAADWMTTAHATAFTQQIDGLASDHFGPDCISCHTTGFNNREAADNGGFDDLAREAGWSFPETLEPGNWDAMVEEFPEVAGMANIQCEACHGPGDLHVFEASRRDSMISLGLEYGVCAQCHTSEPYHAIPLQWENSAHADKNARAFWYPTGEDHAECVQCHSGAGFIDAANGLPVEEQRTEYQVITCAVCHDPHDADHPNQLRVFDSVVLPDGTEVSEAGPAATCMSCHNTRVDPVASVEGPAEGGRFSTPHYSSAAELMNATGGYTWGETLPTSTHGRAIDDTCISCHMAATPGNDADGNPLEGHNTIGGHSFAMTDENGLENVAVCQTCHDAAESFAFEARRDYDGDGTIETNQDEVAGLLALLEESLTANGVAVLDHYPYFEIPEDASVDVYGAIYNFKLSQDGAAAVHNLRYTVALLQLSYEKLTGEAVPGATILPPK
jgi:hypothetical protein